MNRKLLLLILFLGFLLRLIWLDKYPSGFTPDEASFGYDAYSILGVGKDQWGESFPIVLKSFGDYKAPIYSYLTIPSIFLFGLTKFAVRMPNSLFSLVSIFVTYKLALELGQLLGFSRKKSEVFGLISAFLLTISSWHVMMSRGAFEANLTTFFMPLGVYLFIKGCKNSSLFYPPSRKTMGVSPWMNAKNFLLRRDFAPDQAARRRYPGFQPGGLHFVFSAVAFGLNLFTYHSAKLVTPIIVLSLIVIFKEKLVKINKKILLIPATIFSLFILLTIYTFTLGAGTRASQISIFNGASNDAAQPRLSAINNGVPPILARTLHNKYLVIGKRFINNYFQYFSPQFLFTNGLTEATYGMIPGRGILYWFELPFLFGFSLFFLKDKSKYKYLSIVWLLA